MVDYPKVIYNEYAGDENDSGAKNVENILKEVDSLNGEGLTYLNILKFENLLCKLLYHVTLIGFEIRPKVYKSKPKPDDEELLVYYYNEVFVHILKLQLMVDHGLGGYTLTDLVTYKIRSVNDKKCLVYDIDDRYGENVFKINYDLSNSEYVIPIVLNEGKFKLVVE